MVGLFRWFLQVEEKNKNSYTVCLSVWVPGATTTGWISLSSKSSRSHSSHRAHVITLASVEQRSEMLKKNVLVGSWTFQGSCGWSHRVSFPSFKSLAIQVMWKARSPDWWQVIWYIMMIVLQLPFSIASCMWIHKTTRAWFSMKMTPVHIHSVKSISRSGPFVARRLATWQHETRDEVGEFDLLCASWWSFPCTFHFFVFRQCMYNIRYVFNMFKMKLIYKWMWKEMKGEFEPRY